MTGAETATLLRPQRETIPEELKARPQWVAWRREERDGKLTKVPYCAKNHWASSTASKTWLTFENAWRLYEAGGFDGVGYVFAANDPYAGIDLDGKDPGGLSETEQRAIAKQAGSYVEQSPSGTGLHIIVKATLPSGGRKKGPIEVYDRARYFTITGHVIEGASMVIEGQQEAVDWLLATYFNDPEPETRSERVDPPDLSDQALLDKAFAASNGDKLRRLWNGDTTDYPSASEADMALASLLAFWTGPDAMKLETLMRGSGLAREKWDKRHYGDGQTYLEAVVTKALIGRTEFYAPGSNGHKYEQPDRPEFAANGNSNGEPLAPLRALADSPTAADIEAALRIVVNSLAGVDGLRRATLRQEALSILKAKEVIGPAKLVDAAWALAGGSTDEGGAQPLTLADPEPWPEPVDGATLLKEIEATLTRFLILPRGATLAIALWVLHAYAVAAFAVSPILTVVSATMRCGKTTLLSLLSGLLPRALPTANITPAALFRCIEQFDPTLLIDEGDTFLAMSDELRGVLNAGHTRTAGIVRTVGEEFEPRLFRVFGPKVLAMIGKPPGTIEDRSIVIPMKRKAPGEQAHRFRLSVLPTLEPICRMAARWAHDHVEELKDADPDVPESLNDRAADNWRPLLAIADRAGGDWPDRARTAALILSGGERDPEADGAGVALIGDCVSIFKGRGVDRLSTTDLIGELVKIEERPWGEWTHGKPITSRGVAKLLKPFSIKPKVERAGGVQFRGYEADAFDDAFSRYSQGSNVYHAYQPNENNELDPNFNVYQTPDGTDTKSDLSIEKERNGTHGTDRNPENSLGDLSEEVCVL